ncbi:MAG: hypothetical protein ACP5JH_01910 [Bacteroidota bacterium]
MKRFSWAFKLFVFILAGSVLVFGGCSDRIIPPENQASARGAELGYFDANMLSSAIRWDGDFSASQATAGTLWPRSAPVPAIYDMGIWIGGEVSGSVGVSGVMYGSEFTPGKIGTAGSAGVFKLIRGSASHADSAAWPIDLGAPHDSLGEPLIYGDETLWTIYNDSVPTAHFRFQTAPLYVEIQQTVFGYGAGDPWTNTMFIKFQITNRGGLPIDQMYIGFFADVDLGNASDDFAGWDAGRSCAYGYNSMTDSSWQGAPPALGIYFLKTPVVQTMERGTTAFLSFVRTGDPQTAAEAYWMLRGRSPAGAPIIDPTTQRATTFMYAGDPVAHTGWIDSVGGDKRLLLSTGPITLLPDETQTLLLGITIAQGATALNSISQLLHSVEIIRLSRTFWDF